MINTDIKRKELDILFYLVQDRYGDRLNPEELEEVRKGIKGIVETAEALRSVKLENSDEPFLSFIPYKKDEL